MGRAVSKKIPAGVKGKTEREVMDFTSMTDDEILENMTEVFEEDGRLNLSYIDFEVVGGSLTISGRVSSDEELQMVEEILEQIKFANYKNDVWVDEALGITEADEDESQVKDLNFDGDDDIEEDFSGDDDEYDV